MGKISYHGEKTINFGGRSWKKGDEAETKDALWLDFAHRHPDFKGGKARPKAGDKEAKKSAGKKKAD